MFPNPAVWAGYDQHARARDKPGILFRRQIVGDGNESAEMLRPVSIMRSSRTCFRRTG